MRFLIYFCLFSQIIVYAQVQNVASIHWKGNKKMCVKFMTNFIETKVGQPLDSLKINRDIAALTRLNGISNVTYEVAQTSSGFEVNYTLIENWSVLPNVNLWTTDEAAAAYRIGLYDYNFLGRNATIGGFYQSNGAPSYGINFSAPFLFSSNFVLLLANRPLVFCLRLTNQHF